jgi:hypothetical protein
MPHPSALDICRSGPQPRCVLGQPGGLLVGEVGDFYSSDREKSGLRPELQQSFHQSQPKEQLFIH